MSEGKNVNSTVWPPLSHLEAKVYTSLGLGNGPFCNVATSEPLQSQGLEVSRLWSG
jgi:hypothetical protein